MTPTKPHNDLEKLKFVNRVQAEIINAQRIMLEELRKSLTLDESRYNLRMTFVHHALDRLEVIHKNQKSSASA